MNVLSIGNSFSEDAQRYLHTISQADNNEIYTANLCIGGCPLSLHHKHMLSQEKAYEYVVNGSYSECECSLGEGIGSRSWDVITIQQVSHQAPYYATFQPYLNDFVDYIRKKSPESKIVIQQTWAYEQGSYRLNTELGFSDYKDMLRDIVSSYDQAQTDVNADYIIPSGELMALLIENGVEKVHRDTFHASLGIGRYAIGLLWYRFITGRSIKDVDIDTFDETVSNDEIAIAKICIEELAVKYNR